MMSHGTISSGPREAAQPVDDSEDLLAALADGVLDERPPPHEPPAVTAGFVQPLSCGRGMTERGGEANGRLPTPCTAGASQAAPGKYVRDMQEPPGSCRLTRCTPRLVSVLLPPQAAPLATEQLLACSDECGCCHIVMVSTNVVMFFDQYTMSHSYHCEACRAGNLWAAR